MKTTQRLICSFTLEYHPLVARLLSEEITLQFNPIVFEHFQQDELQLLLQTITLHVIPTAPEHYLLLMPDPLFARLRQHPFVQKQKIRLCEHHDSADNIEQIILTLMLKFPALQYNYQSSTLKTLAARLTAAKSSPKLTTQSLPKKNLLALFAGVSPTAIRFDNSKLANSKVEDKA